MTLTHAQRAFLALHTKHVVDKWKWHFCETQLRAHAGDKTATIWRDELNQLVAHGLMYRGVGYADYHATMNGRDLVCAASKT